MKLTSLNSTLLSFGVCGFFVISSVGALMTSLIRFKAVLASIMPLAANMILASAVEMIAEKTA